MEGSNQEIIGWQKTKVDQKAIIENNVISGFNSAVEIKEKDSGALVISVTHNNAQKASEYANAFMEEIRKLVESESREAQEHRLLYLSETLADALQDMEKAQENLKNYALKNSAMAQENFISGSLQLNEIRMEKRKVEEISDLLYIIENIIKSGNLDNTSYEALRASHPLVDDIDFRRILGMSETISAWTWPEIETIYAIGDTLRDRIKRLDVDISNIGENAQFYASSAEDLAKFTRDATIAEATYTVLIEQVKSQSLAAGFQPNTFKVFEYATPPVVPSSPNRNVALALGAILGIFIGSVLAILNSARRGVFYTRSAILNAANADLSLKSRPILKLSRKSISDIIAFIAKRRIAVLDEAVIKLANKGIIYVINSGGRVTATNAALLLVAQSAQSGRNIVLCDTTGQVKKEINKNKLKDQNFDAATINIDKNINLLTEVDEPSFFLSKNFKTTIKNLTNEFDQVFICSSNKNAQLGLMALAEFAPCLVLISGLRKTKNSP